MRHRTAWTIASWRSDREAAGREAAGGGAPSQDAARLMAFKLVMPAAKTWRRLLGEHLSPKVVQGVTSRDGVEVADTPTQGAA